MEAPLDARDLVRPWRRATIAASLVAAVELVLLLVGGAVLVAKPVARAVEHRAEGAASAAAEPKTAARAKAKAKAAPKTPAKRRHAALAKPALARAQTKVLVLNGNGRTGAAHSEAVRLRSLGYRIAGAANAARDDYATTIVMYRQGFAPEGERLARDLHVAVVGPLDGLRPSALDGGQLAVILGAAA